MDGYLVSSGMLSMAACSIGRPLAEGGRRRLRSGHVVGVRRFRGGGRVGEDAGVEVVASGWSAVPQIVGEHGHTPRSAFGGGGHDLDRGVECGGENLLRDLRRGEDATVADERVDGDAFVLGHHIHADLDRREGAKQLGSHEVAEAHAGFRTAREQRAGLRAVLRGIRRSGTGS